MQICASCEQENPAGFRFCGNCGAELAAPSPAREVRKTVTVLFCDVTGSTAMGERLDDARTALEQALAGALAKGNVVTAEQARTGLAALP